MSGRPTVFLDRDGVLDEPVFDPRSGVAEAPLRARDVVLVEGALAAAARLADAGFQLACVSNQPAAAKGLVSVDELLRVHARVIGLLAAGGVSITESRLCLHHPQGVVKGLAGVCACRKPAPGMLLDLGDALNVDMAASWMVGDTDTDIAAGRAAGCRTLLVEHPLSAHKRGGQPRPDLRTASLREGASAILEAAVGDTAHVAAHADCAQTRWKSA